MNHSIISRAAIARHAQASADSGAGCAANPYPAMHPAHAVWLDCFAVARACAGPCVRAGTVACASAVDQEATPS